MICIFVSSDRKSLRKHRWAMSQPRGLSQFSEHHERPAEISSDKKRELPHQPKEYAQAIQEGQKLHHGSESWLERQLLYRSEYWLLIWSSFSKQDKLIMIPRSLGSILNSLQQPQCTEHSTYTHIHTHTHTHTHIFVVQSLSYVRLFVIPWTIAHQASLSFTICQSLLKFMSIELVMLSNHLVLCCPLCFLPSIFPSSEYE